MSKLGQSSSVVDFTAVNFVDRQVELVALIFVSVVLPSP